MNNYHAFRSAGIALLGAIGFLLVGIAPASDAAVPEGINYQAYLTNADGTPVDSAVTITFVAYNVDVGGVPLWNQTESVTVEQGLFTTQLANPANPFPADLFDGPVYIGMFVAGEEMLPRRPMTTSAFSFKANDADTVDGADASDLDQSGDVSALQSDVSDVQSDVSAVEGLSSSNEGRISSLESSAGDITGVTAGQGLAGGGATGNVAVSIANGGVTSAMIGSGQVGTTDLAAGAVTTPNIANGAITAAKIGSGAVGPASIDPNGTYDVGGLTIGTSGLDVISPLDMVIRDDVHGLRWRLSDDSAEIGSIIVSANSMSMRHSGQDQPIFDSNATGLAIGGGNPTSGYAVTVPSLNVAGNIRLGHTIESVIYPLNLTNDECNSHGNLPCFYGTAAVTCPVGTRILGGGSSGSSARFGSLAQSYPTGNTGWFCGSSYDIANSNDTCYAICARVE